MTTYFLMDDTRQQLHALRRKKGDIKSLKLDCSSWADDNGAVTTAVWTVESGNFSIGTETLANNVAASIITSNEVSRGMIKLVISNATLAEATYFDIIVTDPQAPESIPDLGFDRS